MTEGQIVKVHFGEGLVEDAQVLSIEPNGSMYLSNVDLPDRTSGFGTWVDADQINNPEHPVWVEVPRR